MSSTETLATIQATLASAGIPVPEGKPETEATLEQIDRAADAIERGLMCEQAFALAFQAAIAKLQAVREALQPGSAGDATVNAVELAEWAAERIGHLTEKGEVVQRVIDPLRDLLGPKFEYADTVGLVAGARGAIADGRFTLARVQEELASGGVPQVNDGRPLLASTIEQARVASERLRAAPAGIDVSVLRDLRRLAFAGRTVDELDVDDAELLAEALRMERDAARADV